MGDVIAGLKRDRDGWVEKAAAGSQTILSLRRDNARMMAEIDRIKDGVARLVLERDAAWKEVESLREQCDRLKSMFDDLARASVEPAVPAASAAVGPGDLGSWSGLREGR